jgi:hypothetical protein
MNTLRATQVCFFALAAFFMMMAIGTTFRVFPLGLIILTISGMQRMADTLLLFSIAVGVYQIVIKKK